MVCCCHGHAGASILIIHHITKCFCSKNVWILAKNIVHTVLISFFRDSTPTSVKDVFTGFSLDLLRSRSNTDLCQGCIRRFDFYFLSYWFLLIRPVTNVPVKKIPGTRTRIDHSRYISVSFVPPLTIYLHLFLWPVSWNKEVPVANRHCWSLNLKSEYKNATIYKYSCMFAD